MELNLFVPFFLRTAAVRLRTQLPRAPVSLLQAPACTGVGPPRRRFPSVCPLLAVGRPSSASLSVVRGWSLVPVGRNLELPPRPGVELSPFKNRQAAECGWPGPGKATCGHTLGNHASPDRLCFHCSDLWETCETQAVWRGGGGTLGGASGYKARLVWQSPFRNPSVFRETWLQATSSQALGTLVRVVFQKCFVRLSEGTHGWGSERRRGLGKKLLLYF